MKNFLTLLKIDLLRLFGINKAIHSGKGAGRIFLIVAVGLILGLLFIGQSAVLTATFVNLLPVEEKYKALAPIVLVYTIIVLILSIGSSKLLYAFQDYDMLMAMPIKTSHIFLSKIAYAYFLDLLFGLAYILPAAITYGIITVSLPISLLSALLLVFFLPLFPLVVALAIGTLFTYFYNKIKNKNIAKTLFAFVFIALYFVFVFKIDNLEESALLSILNSPLLVPFNFVAKALGGNILNVAIIDLSAAFLTFLFVILLSWSYKKLNSLITTKNTSGKFVMKEQKQSSLFKTLFMRDFKMLTASSTSLINSLVGPIIAIGLMVAFLIGGGIKGFVDDGTLSPSDLSNYVNEALIFMRAAMPFVPIFFLGLSQYADYGISLEGKRVWILKSLPVPTKQLLISKLAVSCMFAVPSGVIAVILFGIGIYAPFYEIIFSAVIVAAYTVFCSFLGLNVNLKFNFFDWKNEAEVVKRGTSATICMFVGMLAVIPLAIIQVLASFVSYYLGWIIVFALITFLNVFLAYLLFNNCEQKIKRLAE